MTNTLESRGNRQRCATDCKIGTCPVENILADAEKSNGLNLDWLEENAKRHNVEIVVFSGDVDHVGDWTGLEPSIYVKCGKLIDLEDAYEELNIIKEG